jgi:hypothetical protein
MRTLTRMLTVRLPLILGSGLLGLGLLAAGFSATAQDLLPWSTQPPKPAPDVEAAPRVPVTQGDTVDDPLAMPAIHVAVSRYGLLPDRLDPELEHLPGGGR